MPKKPGTNPKGEFAFFNVVYEDDSQRSNRRVPSELLGGLEGDEPARAYIHAQDQEIAEKGGRPALEIKSISRVGARKKKRAALRGIKLRQLNQIAQQFDEAVCEGAFPGLGLFLSNT